MTDIILHGSPFSGHAHRVALLLKMLGLPFQVQDANAQIRRTPEFLALNPLGQIPVLQDGDLTLADSNAIMIYLCKRYAPGSQWLLEDPVGAARIQRWLSIAAGEIQFGASYARAISQWNFPGHLPEAHRVANRILSFMDQYLNGRTFLAADHATIADLACYSYVAHAPEGGVPLDAYSHVRAWLKRVEALPHFYALPASPIPKAS
ncbi:MAG TPA: glutathione S-transferase N-terminal domain-containing protein [Xanthobacteraceae bacterium]|jgi:glutathione S-transferase|nr:glutathione S-transferase N-terminal domain-containing protein [Xanthobacteraceae bacterium]